MRVALQILCVTSILLWFLGRSLLTRLLRSSPRCLPLPPGLLNNVSAAPSADEPSFVLLWSTNASSFTLRSRRCLESILYHHPKATVRVYSNELPHDFFAEFRRERFDVRLKRYNATRLLGSTPAAPWLLRYNEWRKGPYFYSHVTDAIRLALLFRVGGVYLDTDVLLARPIRLRQATTAAASGGGGGSGGDGPPPLHDALGIESYADARTGKPALNGAVMAFGRGSRFLYNALHEFGADYKPDRWSWNGPDLLTRVQLRCERVEGAKVQVEPPERFYPLYWDDVSKHADGKHSAEDAKLWEGIRSRAYAVHVWNRKTNGLLFEKGSLLYKLHNTWMVLPGREECT